MMSKRRRLLVWFGGFIGILLALLIGSLLLLPKLINLDSVKEKALTSISKKVAGTVTCQRLDLVYFPYPHVAIKQLGLSIPETISGTIKTLHVYPRILPLIKREVQISEVQVEAADFNISLISSPKKEEQDRKPFSFESVEEKMLSLLAPAALGAPDLIIGLEKVKLSLNEEEKPLFYFQDIKGRFRFTPGKLTYRLSCNSNLWERISLKGSLDVESFKGHCRIDLKRFEAHTLSNYLRPHSTRSLVDSELNLIINLNMDGAHKALRAELEGSLPHLTIRRGKEKATIKGRDLNGAIYMDEEKIEVSLKELNLDDPRLTASGKFIMNPEPPKLRMEIEGRNVETDRTREAALAVAGDMEGVQEVFEYIKGGQVPWVTIQIAGNKPDDLNNLENMLIKGRMVEGRIYVPDVDLDLVDVNGDAFISKTILKGENLGARYGNSRGREGLLKVGLKGKDAPFHLDIMVDGDLAEVPSFLKGVVGDETFLREIGLVENVEGRATGRLVLGESTGAIKPRVDVNGFHLSAKYQRIPYAIKLKGGNLTYDETRISVKNLDGFVGKSSVSNASGWLELKKVPRFQIAAGRADILAEELYPWLISIETFPLEAEDLKSIAGNIIFSKISLQGPLSEPEKWLYRADGEMRNIALKSSLLPGTLELANGRFRVDEAAPLQRLEFENAQTSLLDASFNVSGVLKDYFKGFNSVELRFEGYTGPEANRWISDLIHLPSSRVLRTPLDISGAHLIWEKGVKTDFKGNLAVRKGPNLSLDVLETDDELLIRNLIIKDEESEVTCSLDLKKNEALSFRFAGRITKRTTDRLLVESNLPDGWLEGDFSLNIQMDHLGKSTAQGKLKGGNLTFLRSRDIPIDIDEFSLNGEKDHIELESSALTLGENHLELKGDVDFSTEGFLIDFDLSADRLDWADIKETFQKKGEKGEGEKSEVSEALPVEGKIRVKSENFKWESLNWNPFHAEVLLTSEGIDVSVTEADLCGISTPGILKVRPQQLSLDIETLAKDRQLDLSLDCLFGKGDKATGRFDLEGKIKTVGKAEEWIKSSQGHLEFNTRKGRIYQAIALSRILAYLNVTEMFFGKFPGIGKEGLGYHSIKAKMNLQNGKLALKEAIMDGESMDVACSGGIDLIERKLDLEFLVAPLKTVDRVVKWTPILGHMLAGTLVSIPVKVTGDIMNPQVKTMPASSVGSGLLGMMKRTFTLPVKVVEPVISKDNLKN
jgi:hypothetical protein